MCLCTHECVCIYITGPVKIDHVGAKESTIFLFLLHHNLIAICTSTTKSFTLPQNLMGFLLQFTEIWYSAQKTLHILANCFAMVRICGELH